MAVKTAPAPARREGASQRSAMAFSFADTIAGYVKRYDRNADSFTMETSDGREFTVGLTDTTGAQLVRNLGEPYVGRSSLLNHEAQVGFDRTNAVSEWKAGQTLR